MVLSKLRQKFLTPFGDFPTDIVIKEYEHDGKNDLYEYEGLYSPTLKNNLINVAVGFIDLEMSQEEVIKKLTKLYSSAVVATFSEKSLQKEGTLEFFETEARTEHQTEADKINSRLYGPDIWICEKKDYDNIFNIILRSDVPILQSFSGFDNDNEKGFNNCTLFEIHRPNLFGAVHTPSLNQKLDQLKKEHPFFSLEEISREPAVKKAILTLLEHSPIWRNENLTIYI